MREKKISDEEFIFYLEQGMSLYAIANQHGMNRASLTRRRQLLVKKGILPHYKHGFYDPIYEQINTNPKVKDVPVPDGHVLKGVSTYYDNQGAPRNQWVKSKLPNTTHDQEIERLSGLVDKLLDRVPAVPTIDRYTLEVDENLLACYPLGDRHIGMMAWKAECGKDWDLKIAKKVLCDTFEKVVKKAPPCQKALIVNLGDYLHSDNLDGFTMRSKNILDMDSRYSKMMDVGIEIFLFMIDTCLSYHEEVDVENIPGNHDEIGTRWLTRVLKAHYRDNPRVNIRISEEPIHCYQWGKVMIAMHHGHTISMQKLPGVCAADHAKTWGNTVYRYGLMGHIHKDSEYGNESDGMKVRSFRTLAAPDSYAKWHGYRSGCDTKAIVYHKNDGQVEEHTINIK